MGQPDAEQFLRAATTLKPTANVDEGHARAWLSLAHVLETAKPDQAIEAYQHAAALDPKDPRPHLSAGLLLEKESRFADAEQEYKQALVLDPGSADALEMCIRDRRTRIPQPIPGIFRLFYLWRSPPAYGGAAGENQWQEYLRRMLHDGRSRVEIL